MARSRSLKPGFFKNERLSELPPFGRLLFAGLWTIADREGRLEDRPRRILAEIFPYERINVDKLLQQLHDSGFIYRYQADGVKYIAIPAWKKHQNPHVKEGASTIPAPCEHGTGMVLVPAQHCTSPADSLNPITCNLNPVPIIPPRPVAAGKKPSARKAQPPGFEDWFETTFWRQYPRKVGKPQAAKALMKRDAGGGFREGVMAALARDLPVFLSREPDYIPHPATWINREPWADAPAEKPRWLFDICDMYACLGHAISDEAAQQFARAVESSGLDPTAVARCFEADAARWVEDSSVPPTPLDWFADYVESVEVA